MNIIMLGPPGIGKGTNASKLSNKLGILHISTGNMLRENAAYKTELGMKAKSYMDRGLLVPDELVIEMVKERLGRDDCKDGFILDGFPRTIKQADELAKDIKIEKVINLQASDEIIVERISKRRVCSECGYAYHLDFIKPNREGFCDKCSSSLYQRDDDKPESVKKRLEVYREQTEPLIKYYKDKGVLVDVDGSGAPDDVFLLVDRAASS